MTNHMEHAQAALQRTDHLPLLSELLRPKSLDELILPEHLIAPFRAYLETGSIPNLLLYGKPGTGKTSAARLVLEYADSMELNGSSKGDQVDRIETFASGMSLIGKPKVCFIDEADCLTTRAQASLRKVMEDFSGNARFIFTANEVDRLSPAMRSRFINVCFDPKPSQAPDVIRRIIPFYETRLAAHGYCPDAKVIRNVVHEHYPDFRAIVGHLEFALKPLGQKPGGTDTSEERAA